MSGSSASGTINDRALTLDRGIRVLKLLAGSDHALSVGSIAKELSLHRQVVYRLLGTLHDHGLVVKAETRGYRLGFGTVALAGPWLPSLETAVRPLLQTLAAQCSATSFLTICEGAETMALLVVEPAHTDFYITYRAGARYPLDRGAPGIAILAGRPPVAAESADVTAARAAGFAVTHGQVTPGAIGVAAPVRLWPRSRVADACVGVIAVAVGADEVALARHVRAAADGFDAVLAGSTPGQGRTPAAI